MSTKPLYLADPASERSQCFYSKEGKTPEEAIAFAESSGYTLKKKCVTYTITDNSGEFFAIDMNYMECLDRMFVDIEDVANKDERHHHFGDDSKIPHHYQ